VCQLLKSLTVATALFIPVIVFSHADTPHSIKGHSKADMMEKCVEPTVTMQKEHFKFLYHQRDKTVIKGVRTKKHSLANCIDCHVSYDDDGKALPVNSEGQFCQACHVQTAVNIDCFSCHASVPRGRVNIPKSSNQSNNVQHIDIVTNKLINFYKETSYE
tara:strand:+ start:60 stop:539 length:480 start_codon:yes stop_codon:yes gene_type:complete